VKSSEQTARQREADRHVALRGFRLLAAAETLSKQKLGEKITEEPLKTPLQRISRSCRCWRMKGRPVGRHDFAVTEHPQRRP